MNSDWCRVVRMRLRVCSATRVNLCGVEDESPYEQSTSTPNLIRRVNGAHRRLQALGSNDDNARPGEFDTVWGWTVRSLAWG